jgi:hypothetical protein
MNRLLGVIRQQLPSTTSGLGSTNLRGFVQHS